MGMRYNKIAESEVVDTLEQLGICDVNPGVCIGPNACVQTENAGILKSFSPASGELIASVNVCGTSDYETVIRGATTAFKAWRMVPAPRRGELIRRIALTLREKKDNLGSLVALEMGKIKEEGDGEVQEMIDIADFSVGQSRMFYGKTMHSERPQHRMYEQWHPLGVVGVITAFNFPVAVWAWNAFIAAAAGNTIVWKPSPKTPLCAIAVQRICNQAMAEMGYNGIFCLFIDKDKGLAERFIRDKRVPLVSFTGSSEVGQRIGEIVATRLGRSLLELSGNNPIIVDESADLDIAVPSIVFGAIGTTGQRCTTTRRLIVHKSLYNDLMERLLHAYRQVRIGDPLNRKVLMGPLIDKTAMENYCSAFDEIRKLGGSILYGGKIVKRPGCFVEPTLVRAENQWPIVQRETFAPILYIMTFKTLDEAITIHNDVPQGLSSALFTNDLRHAEHYLSAVGSDCGIANINIGTSGAEIGGAFGGEKQTGGGREAGSDAWKTYMRRQTNTINWGRKLSFAQGIHFDCSNSKQA